MKNIIPAVLSLILLAGCAHKAEGYPPLTPRAAEANLAGALAEPAATQAPAKASDAQLVQRVKALLDKARAAVPAFEAAASASSAIINRGRGAARGSESWVAAQMAVSRVETFRAPVKAALSDLDNQRRLALLGGPTADAPLLEAAVREVEAIDAKQGAALNEMLKALGH